MEKVFVWPFLSCKVSPVKGIIAEEQDMSDCSCVIRKWAAIWNSQEYKGKDVVYVVESTSWLLNRKYAYSKDPTVVSATLNMRHDFILKPSAMVACLNPSNKRQQRDSNLQMYLQKISKSLCGKKMFP